MDAKEQIERINTLSGIARTSWLAMLGYFAFVGVTLLSVRDADFFMPHRETKLPLVDVSIPTFSFFFFAPLLGAALYVYLHVHLLKLWDAIAAAPIWVGEPIGEKLHPWIANDFALARKSRRALRPRPLRWLGHLATWLLVWVVGPFVLAGFWWRSMPAHSEILTLTLGIAMLASVYAGWISWRAARDWLPDSGARPGPWRRWWRPPVAAAIACSVAIVGWARTEGGAQWWAGRVLDGVNLLMWADEGERDQLGYWRDCFPLFGPREAGDPVPFCLDHFGVVWPPDMLQETRIAATGWIPSDDHALLRRLRRALGARVEDTWRPLARTDLRGVEMVDVPESWRTPETARHAFRQSWCGREGLTMAVCDHPASVDRPVSGVVSQARAAWCGDGIEDCAAHFVDLDQRFETAWREERDAALANLPRLDLRARDLRQADGAGATLIGADLRGARLEGADLGGARLEGADLGGARLEGADLGGARLEGADLGGARLEGANLWWARLEGANLGGARLEGADLGGTRLEGADLGGARLEGADLRGARLEGADLWGTRLEGANLGGARLEGADLWRARLEGADLWGARLEGANLRGARLERVDLRGARLERVDLREADFRGSNWAGASNRASPAQFADFRGGQDLTQEQLDHVIGNAGTLLPNDGNEHGEDFHVWSCWETPPPGLDRIVATAAGPFAGKAELAELRASFLCGRHERFRTGAPLAVDAPYPDGHPLAYRR